MKNNNSFVRAASSLASDGLDVLFEALGKEIKQTLGLPKARPNVLSARCRFHEAIGELIDVTGCAAQWNSDETLAELTIPQDNRNWQVLVSDQGDQGDFIELIAPTGLRYSEGQVPGKLACHLLTQNPRVLCGGWELCTIDGMSTAVCRSTIPADAVTGELLHIAIRILVSEVADLYDRLQQ